MTSTIITKNSSTASSVPSSGSLTQGELAVNVTDKKLYTKDSGGTVVKLVGSLGNQEASAAAITGGSINGTTVGASTTSTGAFTTLSASSTVSGTGFSTYLASPPAIGGTAAAAGSFTTLSASGAVTLSGGTANGVAYLNGSKVVTSGSALTFDGTNFGVGTASPPVKLQVTNSATHSSASIQSADGYNATLFLGDVTSYTDAYIRYLTDVNQMAFAINGASEGMRLTSTGLGIGTSSPAVKLQVAGDGRFTGTSPALTLLRSDSASPSARIRMVGSDNADKWELATNYLVGGAGFEINYAGSNLAFLSQSGNLGLGVTPSAWYSTRRALQVGVGGSLEASTSSYTFMNIGANYYVNTSGTDTYIASNYASRYTQTSGQHQWYTAPSGTAGNAITFTQAMTLDASGQLGIGTTSPTARLELSGSSSQNLIVNSTGSSSYMQFANSGGITGYIGSSGAINSGGGNNALGFRSQNEMVFATGGSTERARIGSSGAFYINCSSSPTSNGTGTGGLNTLVSSGDAFNLKHTVDGATIINLWQTGTTTTAALNFYKGNTQTSVGSITISTTATAYNTSSDYRLKNTIAPMTGALAKVAQLKPVTYKWNVDGSDGEGFIAHELAEVVPQCVTGEKDAVDENGNPKYQGIDTSFLVATLTAAIQELKAEFDAYKASHP